MSMEDTTMDAEATDDQSRIDAESVGRPLGTRHAGYEHHDDGGDDEPSPPSEGAPLVTLDEIDASDQWATVEVTVLAVWPSSLRGMAQRGILGDETGDVDVGAFDDADVSLENGESVRLTNLRVEDARDGFGLTVTDATTVEPLDREVEAAFVTEQAVDDMRV